MRPLIDGDVILHELGWSAEFKDKDSGEVILFDFDKVEELLLQKINIICEDVEATEPPIFFFTDNPYLARREKREFIPGFRYAVAKTKPYKGTRKNPKPFHFYNILAYILGNFDNIIAKDGLEADDLICQTQFKSWQDKDTIICSRDKDLRICPGLHYSWECGKQAAILPKFTDKLGWLDNEEKFIGYGKSFFYYQMLVGDAADNIPGLPGVGHVKALQLLEGCETEWDYYSKVKQLYKDCYENESKERFMEQANLLWMQYNGPYKLPKESNNDN